MEKIDRREFCKGAAGLAGIIAAGYGPSLYAAGANDKIRVACVGYSDRFRGSLLPCFLHHNKELNFDMVAVADLWKKRLYEKAKPELEKAIGHEVETFGSDVAHRNSGLSPWRPHPASRALRRCLPATRATGLRFPSWSRG